MVGSNARDKYLAGAEPFNAYSDKILRQKLTNSHKREKTYSLPKQVRQLCEGKKEAQIQSEIIHLLELKNIFHRRIEGGGKLSHFGGQARIVGSSQKGMADIIACISGLYVAIEVKTCKGRAKASQLNYLADVIKSKGKACIATDHIRLKKWLETGRIVSEIEWDGVYIPVL